MAHRLNPQLDPIKLSKLDPTNTDGYSSKEHAEEDLVANINKLSTLQEMLFASKKQSILVILQGMDTSGKDGLIKHAFSGINPQGCNVYSFKAPSPYELSHTYLWRYAHALPIRGMIEIFNRSYYEETTTVRVHPEYLTLRGLSQSSDLWQKRYKEFNHFEDYLANNHVTVIKIFLHLSKEEQLERLKTRLHNPDKHWKFDLSDIRERSFWDEYMAAYEETINATNSSLAPWHIIPADKKWYARLKFSTILVKKLDELHLSFPELNKDLKESIKIAQKELLG